MLAIRSIVDRYRIDAEMAEGSIATVYAVTHVWLHQQMVLKHLRPGLGPDVAHAMWEEGRIQAGRHHQNIVAVHDALMIEERPALVMERVQGSDLADWLDARERPPLDEALAIFRGVLHGMADAHQAGLVHRDLKPENVLLAERDGLPPLAKVADFGLAKRSSGRKVGSATLSGTYSLIGTPEYMSPEQQLDPGGVDQRADIFSLGAVLYELVTGEVAFEGKALNEVLPRVRRGEYRPARWVRSEVPESLERLIGRMLQVDPAKRPDSCEEVLHALDQVSL